MIKEDYPKNSIVYISQGFLTIKDNKIFYYDDHYLLDQINKCINPPEDIHNYICKEIWIKTYHPRYDPVTGQFLDLYESLGFIVVRGDPDNHFLDYGFGKENSKILYSYHKIRIPSLFSGTFFTRDKLQFESGGLQTLYSNVYYFLPSATGRSKEINRHLRYVNQSPIYIPENSFETENNVCFDLLKLDVYCQEK